MGLDGVEDDLDLAGGVLEALRALGGAGDLLLEVEEAEIVGEALLEEVQQLDLLDRGQIQGQLGHRSRLADDGRLCLKDPGLRSARAEARAAEAQLWRPLRTLLLGILGAAHLLRLNADAR